MINFYQQFLCNTALVLAPLTYALKGAGKSLLWSPRLDSAFSAAKLLLATVPVLTHSVPGAAVSLAVDVSDFHVGAVLQQCLQGSWVPLVFSPRSYPLPNPSIPPLIVNSLQLTP